MIPDRMTALVAAVLIAAFLVVFVVRDRQQDEHAEERAEERYWDGVRDGQCERDCQYTHDGGLMANVAGRANAEGDCFCTRWLGEPDWESLP